MVEMQQVQSSAIARIGYDRIKCELFVEFLSGDKYIYQNVPLAVYELFQQVPSKGQFLNYMIKKIYRYQKI